jgi:hypothetical protein
MKIQIDVTRGEETSTVSVSPLAIVGWEKATNRRMSDLASTTKGVGGLGMLDMAIMAMTQERLMGLTQETDPEKWLTWVDEIGPKSEDPTQPDEAALGDL